MAKDKKKKKKKEEKPFCKIVKGDELSKEDIMKSDIEVLKKQESCNGTRG